MGAKGKPAFRLLNAGSPVRPGGRPRSAGEARLRELLGAALEREPHGLGLRAGALLEGHRDNQAVDADPQLARVDPHCVDALRVGLGEALDRLAVEDERDARDLGSADPGVERLRRAASGPEQSRVARGANSTFAASASPSTRTACCAPLASKS